MELLALMRGFGGGCTSPSSHTAEIQMQLRIQVCRAFCGKTTLKQKSAREREGERKWGEKETKALKQHSNISNITIWKEKKQARGRSQVAPHPENFPASPFWFAWTDNDDKAGQLIAVSQSWFFTSVPRR